MSICILYVYKYVSGIYLLYNATHTLENFSCSGYTVHKFSQNYSAKCRQKTRQKISYPWNFAKLSNLFLKSKLNYTQYTNIVWHLFQNCLQCEREHDCCLTIFSGIFENSRFPLNLSFVKQPVFQAISGQLLPSFLVTQTRDSSETSGFFE